MHVTTARLGDFAAGAGEDAGAQGVDFDDASWLEVALPIDVHTALIEAGRIPHPYADANEAEVAWVAQREWWYRCHFDAPTENADAAERWCLELPGVDTDVEVWLNGKRIGEHHSMFRPAEFDVTETLIRNGHNVLALRFANVVDDGDDVSDVAVRDTLRIGRRKMQVAYGWDISCYLLTVGVWQPIAVVPRPPLRLRGVTFSTVHLDHRYQRAVVEVGTRVLAEAGTLEGVRIEYRLTSVDGGVVAAGEFVPDGDGAGTALAVIENPRLWWTHDLGEPVLHTLEVSLLRDGRVLDRRTASVGIRTVELDQSPDQDEPPSRFFRFVLNGRPLFARGANWVPEDLRLATVPGGAYQSRIAQAVAANMNMIRVWGGGSYEQDSFYDACDENGLLIWHDFMFACLPYPDDDEAFVAEAEKEARYQVARLQTHPSLALWCGNNEAHMGGSPLVGRALFGGVLPGAVANEDGSRPYWPGSPYGGNGFNSITDGDTHDWRGFHGTSSAGFGEEGSWDPSGTGRHWRRYATDIGRFVSEFGFAAPATRTTIAHWISESERHERSRSWQDRIRYVPGDSHVPLLETVTGAPRSSDEWLDFTQLIQADGVRFGIERFRERKPHCSGALLWQLNDCWPGFTWSIVDFDGNPKPAYYAVRRAFSPVHVSINPLRGGQFEVWLVNDSPLPVDDVLVVRIQRFDGVVLNEQRFPVRAAASSDALLVRRFGWGRVIQPRSCYVVVESQRGTVPANHQLFADLRDLELPRTRLDARVQQVDRRTVDVVVRADAFVPVVGLEHPEALDYDDNYFAVHPGVARTIRAWHDTVEIDPHAFTVRPLFGDAESRLLS